MTDEQLRWATGNRSLSVSPNNKFRNVDLPAEVSPAKIELATYTYFVLCGSFAFLISKK